MEEGTLQKIEKECDDLAHTVRNGTAKIEGLLHQIENVLKECAATIKVVKAEIEAIIEEDI